jgi:hypothetical protein
MIAQNAPVLQSGDGVLDAGSSAAVSTPLSVTHDSVLAKHRCDQLGDAALSAVREDTAVLLA